ncbi:MAG: DUF378 domain-containing protein [Alphaproteobacteria bacterium]|nr:DUF378 domain-containing protein [Alphaproteobacteria bacterium]MCL2890047.1 DUF378 domain-containing protein [Alphaproteobacteria bacterium]
MMELKRYVIKPLLIFGGLNWGSIGFFNYDFIAAIFQNITLIRIVDGLIGLAAVAWIVLMVMYMNDKK